VCVSECVCVIMGSEKKGGEGVNNGIGSYSYGWCVGVVVTVGGGRVQ
jgi:hypothetical protein